jgi:beta-glucosidase
MVFRLANLGRCRMGFNKDIITGLLRNTYHFNGIVCTDWGLLTDSKAFGIQYCRPGHMV